MDEREKAETLVRYAEMWEGGAAGEWAVLMGQKPSVGVPYNIRTGLMRVIENDEIAFLVVEKMLEAGVRVIRDGEPLPGPIPRLE
jgi:hypothetical protein